MHTPDPRWKGCCAEFKKILPKLVERAGCDDWELARKPVTRRKCLIYFLKSESFRVPGLVLKIYKGTVGSQLAKNLHQKSQQLHNGAIPGCTVPEPVMLFAKRSAMAMEYVNAPTAGVLLMKTLLPDSRRRALIGKAGRWLRWFHQHAGTSVDPLGKEILEKSLLKTLEKVQLASPGALAADGFLKSCVEFSGELAARFDGVPTPHSPSHGDFTPFNLLIDRETAVGIDYQMRIHRPVAYDISRFLVYLDVCRINHDYAGFGRMVPTSTADLGTCGCCRSDFETFMAAYEPEGAAMDRDLWLGFQFLEVTRRIAIMKIRQARLQNRFFRIMENAKLRHRAAVIMERLR